MVMPFSKEKQLRLKEDEEVQLLQPLTAPPNPALKKMVIQESHKNEENHAIRR